MNGLRYAIICAGILVGTSASRAHEGHDHGGKSHDRAVPQDALPPAPPSGTFVPESQPLQGNPQRSRSPLNDRNVPVTPAPGRNPAQDSFDFEADSFELLPDSQPRGVAPTPYDRIPQSNQWQRQEFETFEPMLHGLDSQSTCPFRRNSHRRLRIDTDRWVCPRQNEPIRSLPNTFEHELTDEYRWQRGQPSSQEFNRFERPTSVDFSDETLGRRPAGQCRRCGGMLNDFDNAPPGSIRESTPYLPSDGAVPLPQTIRPIDSYRRGHSYR